MSYILRMRWQNTARAEGEGSGKTGDKRVTKKTAALQDGKRKAESGKRKAERGLRQIITEFHEVKISPRGWVIYNSISVEIRVNLRSFAV